MWYRSRHTLLRSKFIFSWLLLAATIALTYAIAAPSPASAYQRNTTYICNRVVTIISPPPQGANAFAKLPDGRDYITFEYILEGNDNARRFSDPAIGGAITTEQGSYIDSAINCSGLNNADTFWPGGTNINLTDPVYNFGGRTPQIIWGIPPGATPNVAEDYTNPLIGILDECQNPAGAPPGACNVMWREFMGLTNNATTSFATINDAGLVQFNGTTRWCAGMALPGFDPYTSGVCRFVDAADVYSYGGDFGGYQNTDSPCDVNRNAGSICNVDPNGWQALVSGNQDIAPQIGLNFDFRIIGMNTRDSVDLFVPGMSITCDVSQTKPGEPPCLPGFGDPYIKSKTSIILTYVLDPLGSPPPPTPPPIPPDPNYYQIEPRVDSITLTPGASTSSLQITSRVNRPLSTIPSQGLLETLKRYVWIENPDGSVHVYDFQDSLTYPSELHQLDSGWDDRYEIGRQNEKCIAPVEGGSGACGSDLSVLNDRWNVPNSELEPGTRVCTLLLVRTHFGTADASGNGTPTPPVDFNAYPGLQSANPSLFFTGNSVYAATEIMCTPQNKLNPYLRVYGGDVLAGSGFGDSCNPAASVARIVAYNILSTGLGSAAQLAVQAWSTIDGFASATQRSSPGPPRGLTFANTTGNYGGDFRQGICARDYFADSSSPFVGNRTYGGTSIDTSNDTPIYVDGDVRIRDDIRYDTSGWDADNIPNFYLVVRGDIYIDPDVERLDGIYVAQPRLDGSGGYIYTCSKDNQMQIPSSPDDWDECADEQLTIRGAFVAQAVKFFRTSGTISDSTAADDWDDGNPGEVFINGPETWMAASPVPAANFGVYDYIRSLPPVL